MEHDYGTLLCNKRDSMEEAAAGSAPALLAVERAVVLSKQQPALATFSPSGYRDIAHSLSEVNSASSAGAMQKRSVRRHRMFSRVSFPTS